MDKSRLFRALLILALSSLPLLASSGAGWLGISISVKGSGAVWNPTVKTIRIAKVAPNSPAENQHLSAGDMLIEVEGTPVLGAKSSDLRSKMERDVGEVIHLTLKRPNGETYPPFSRQPRSPNGVVSPGPCCSCS